MLKQVQHDIFDHFPYYDTASQGGGIWGKICLVRIVKGHSGDCKEKKERPAISADAPFYFLNLP